MRKKLLLFITTAIFFFLLSNNYSYALTFEFTSYAYTFDNADFRYYDHTMYQRYKSVDYLNTDDRMSFIYYNITINYSRKYKNSEFFLKIYRSGFYGSDNLEGRDDGKNPILFSNIYFIYYPFKGFSFKLGRYYFNIGDAKKDYFFSDTIDGIVFTYDLSKNISFKLEGDILGIGARPEGTRIWFGIEKDDEIIEDFNGDVISARGGLIAKAYFAKVFSFILRYGATTDGGADISESGRSIVNRADGDYLSLSGLRLFYDFDFFGSTDLTVAYSYGQDRQYERDKTYNGFAVALNHSAKIDTKYLRKIGLSTGYFHPKFCSMKAASMGGILLWAYKGYFASPYAYFYHFKDYSKRAFGKTYVDKTASKTFAKYNMDFKLLRKLKLKYHTLVLFANEDKLKYMGWENEITLNLNLEYLLFELMGAIYLPSKYYKRRAYYNTYIPWGNKPFYGMSFSATYKLVW